MGTRIGTGVSAWALVLMLAAATAAFAAPAPQDARGLGRAPAGLMAVLTQHMVRAAARNPAYQIDSRGCARLSAEHFEACFTPGGARFHTGWATVQLRLVAWGRLDHLSMPAQRPDRVRANRVDWRGDGLDGWWRVMPFGYEQGFSIDHAPAGHGRIVIEMRANRTPVVRDGDLAWGRLRYGKLWVTDAAGRVLPAKLTVSGRRIVLHFDAAHARYPIRVDPLVWIEQEVTSSDGVAGDRFGHAVALSGNTALVGAWLHTVSGNTEQGAAYIYTDIGGTWSQTAELTASDGAAYDQFGSSVALSGDTALVGAPYHAVGSNPDQGVAYIYTDIGGTWSQTAELTASDGAEYDTFGTSVALSGTTALVGAPGHNVSYNPGEGAAYVYTDIGSSWRQTAELTASDGVANNFFGSSVALSGTTALVGAPQHTVGSNLDQGAAYVFTNSSGTWRQTAELIASDGAAYDAGDGYPVVLSSTTALVGAPLHTVNGHTDQGVVYLYTNSSGTWRQTAELTASDGAAGDQFGVSVALSGTTALVGAWLHTVGGNAGQGAAYLYTNSSGTWRQTAELTASDGAAGEAFGVSVALSGKTALVGAPSHTVNGHTDQGAAYLFGSANLGMVLSTPSAVAHGSDYTSQAILTNDGASASPALSVLMPVPTGTSYVSSSATQGSCSLVSGTVTCNLGSLQASGGSASGSVQFQATAAVGTALTNLADLALSTPALDQITTTVVSHGQQECHPHGKRRTGYGPRWQCDHGNGRELHALQHRHRDHHGER
ncbi:MAG: hypothetical protein ACYCS1_09745 [Gammaproteobacteria bacterium]